jgi:hypothetical protein
MPQSSYVLTVRVVHNFRVCYARVACLRGVPSGHDAENVGMKLQIESKLNMLQINTLTPARVYIWCTNWPWGRPRIVWKASATTGAGPSHDLVIADAC